MPSILEKYYENFAVLDPLKADDKRLSRELFGGFVDSIARKLRLNKNRSFKLLISGHTGCGKSTFFNILAERDDIRQDFFVVKYSINDVVLDREDVTHVDLLLSMAASLFLAAHEQGFGLSSTLIEEIRSQAQFLRGDAAKETIVTRGRKGAAKVGAEVGTPGIISWLKARFLAEYQIDREFRETTRQVFKGRMRDLIRGFDEMLAEMRVALKSRRVLFMVDDTDKLNLEAALDVFDTHGYEIAEPRCNVVFMVNMDMACSTQFRLIRDKIGKDEPFPAIKIMERSGRQSRATRANRKLVSDMILKRISQKCIERKALDAVVMMSGGIVREAVRLMNMSIENAIPGSVVRPVDVDYAALELRNAYNLNQKHMEILKSVLRNPLWVPGDEEDISQPRSPFLELIHILGLIEYRNHDEKWRRPNPVLIPRLRKR